MRDANQEFLQKLDAVAEERRQHILHTTDCVSVHGQCYYLSADGSDENDGRTPRSAWRSLEHASDAALQSGDALLLRRGDIFRGQLKTKSGVTYGAYGTGDKPKIYAWDWNLANGELWEPWDADAHIWHCTRKTLDAGTLVFNEGQFHSRKLIPSYLNGRFVCRNAPDKAFDMRAEMTQDLDLFCKYDDTLTTIPSKGENFPVPVLTPESFGDLYLRCDAGNPGLVFDSIELLARRHLIVVNEKENVHIDNLCLKYTGEHAVKAGGKCVKGLRVTNCEIGWIGGSIQHYLGTDPNYPSGGRGTVTRYGNGVEIYGGCQGYEVSDCWIYQVYDAGITHQISTYGQEYRMEHIVYQNNLIEYCTYSIEYFLEKTEQNASFMADVEISGNMLRFAGYGWGNQRHNQDTPAHIKGWNYENTATRFSVHDNLFDRSSQRLLHLVAKKRESLPEMTNNVYVQTVKGLLGQFGANDVIEPPLLPFDDDAERTITEIFEETKPQVFGIRG